MTIWNRTCSFAVIGAVGLGISVELSAQTPKAALIQDVDTPTRNSPTTFRCSVEHTPVAYAQYFNPSCALLTVPTGKTFVLEHVGASITGPFSSIVDPETTSGNNSIIHAHYFKIGDVAVPFPRSTTLGTIGATAPVRLYYPEGSSVSGALLFRAGIGNGTSTYTTSFFATGYFIVP